MHFITATAVSSRCRIYFVTELSTVESKTLLINFLSEAQLVTSSKLYQLLIT